MKSRSKTIAAVLLCGLTLSLLAGCGAEEYKSKQDADPAIVEKVKSGQPIYTPPPGAPVPGGGGGMTGSPAGAPAGAPGAPPGPPPAPPR